MNARHAVLVEYFATEHTVLVFGVRQGEEPEVAEVALDMSELARFTANRFADSDSVRMAFSHPARMQAWHERGDKLVEPIARWTAPEDIICLVPHGILHYLPLHASKLEGQFLIERNPVVYSPSASVLKYCQHKRERGVQPTKTAAIFGDSRGDLVYARGEAIALGGRLGSNPILGEQVTREAFEREIIGAEFIHFAGHGEFRAVNVLDSGLKLAGGQVLTIRDVFSLRGLSPRLVTLSACETGGQVNRPGDELLGLVRAFLYAGAPSVLASLWRVNDRSTSLLMEHLYKELREVPGCFKIDALRHAILAILKEPQWKSPYHWAPFVLIGDWQ